MDSFWGRPNPGAGRGGGAGGGGGRGGVAGGGVSDEELTAGSRLLAETSGVFTETAGGVTVAAALALAKSGHLKPDDELVLCITGNGLKTVDVVGDTIRDL